MGFRMQRTDLLHLSATPARRCLLSGRWGWYSGLVRRSSGAWRGGWRCIGRQTDDPKV